MFNAAVEANRRPINKQTHKMQNNLLFTSSFSVTNYAIINKKKKNSPLI